MQKESLKLVIVGSVDHGKSTLIGRLLYDTNSLPQEKIDEIKKTCQMLGRDLEFAYLIDHLQEEREKEMTIDTSQTFFKSAMREYIIIDAPGHKEFIQNMMTGASQADAAVLIIDGSEGVVEQTKRHAYILNLLAIKNVIVAVNKIDKLNYDEKKFNTIKNQILEFLEKVAIVPLAVVPISAKNGDNVVKKSNQISWYQGASLLEELDKIAVSHEQKTKNLRLPIQDICKINGENIILGRIENGKINCGDQVKILPQNNKIKIEKILNFIGSNIVLSKEVGAGYNIGAVFNSNELSRGQVICTDNQELPNVDDKIKANIFWLDQNRNYKIGDHISLKCTTQEIDGIIEKIEKRINSSNLELLEKDAKELKHTEVGEVAFNLEKPLVFEDSSITPELGRFVLIQNQNVVAGGIIKSKI
ncbi:MAG: GTP-binding protein [Patescibacteria group bacterium]